MITGSMFSACPEVQPCAFFLTIVVVQNVPLLMTESSMAIGCDVIERRLPEGVPLEGLGACICNRKLRDIRSNVKPVGLPLENMRARMRYRRCPWGAL